MHLIFMPYGAKNVVDMFIENLNQRILPMKCWKEGEKEIYINIQCCIRYLPFGLMEFVFPREFEKEVLTALRFNAKTPYNLNKSILGIKPLDVLKKFLNIGDIPKFEETPGFPVLDLPVSIIPIGVRYDGEIEDPNGWRHEAI